MRETAAIQELYMAHRPIDTWLSYDHYWETLCRTLKELSPARVNAMNRAQLEYWLAVLTRPQTEGDLEEALALAAERIPANELLFLRTWLDHARHVVRRHQGLDEPSDTDDEEQPTTVEPPVRPSPDPASAAPSTSDAPLPPQPTRRSARLRRR
jgi:hypothetical protein